MIRLLQTEDHMSHIGCQEVTEMKIRSIPVSRKLNQAV
jgi:hypothetical protein